MRTTLDLDDDIIAAAKEVARRDGTSAGKVVSDLARKGLAGSKKKPLRSSSGIPLLPSRGSIVTLARVRQAMDEEGV